MAGDVVSVLVGGGLALVGGSGTEWLRDARALRRDERIRAAARQEVRNDFQRETLVELQDAVQRYVRGLGKAMHSDRMALREHGQVGELPPGLSDEIHQAQILTRKLSTRVDDDEIRGAIKSLIESGSALGVTGGSATRSVVDEQMIALGNNSVITIERIGAVIRSL